MVKENIKTQSLSRFRWLCRRGMLELDLLLGQFLDKHFEHLSDSEKEMFEQILDCTDQELYTWLLNGVPSEHPSFEPLLQKIREYVPCKSI